MISNDTKVTSGAGEVVEHLLVVGGSAKVGTARALHVPNPSLAVASFRAVRCTWKRSVGIANGCQSTIPCWKPYCWSLKLLLVSSRPFASLLTLYMQTEQRAWFRAQAEYQCSHVHYCCYRAQTIKPIYLRKALRVLYTPSQTSTPAPDHQSDFFYPEVD